MALDETTQAAIRKDAEAGMSLKEIQDKHSVSYPTAKRYAEGAGKKPGKRSGKKIATETKVADRVQSNGHFAVKMTPEGLDAVWNALPAEKKAELLGNL